MGISKVEINNADGTKNVLVDLTGDTVTADMLAEGVTAHGADGELVTGTIKDGYSIGIAGEAICVESSYGVKTIYLKANSPKDILFRKDSEITLYVANSSAYGDAATEDVAKGKTFTSANGLKLTGTMESGGTVVSDDNCEAYHITSASTALNFKRTDGDVKVWGYGFKSSGMYQKTTYAFCGDGYYTGTSYGTPTKTSVTWRLNSDGTLSGLPSGLTALDVLVTKGI